MSSSKIHQAPPSSAVSDLDLARMHTSHLPGQTHRPVSRESSDNKQEGQLSSKQAGVRNRVRTWHSPPPLWSGMISSTILSSRTGGPTSTCLSRQSSSTDRSQVNTGFLIGLQILERLAQTEIISVWYRNCVILPHMNFPTSTESQYLQQFNSRDLTESTLFLYFPLPLSLLLSRPSLDSDLNFMMWVYSYL